MLILSGFIVYVCFCLVVWIFASMNTKEKFEYITNKDSDGEEFEYVVDLEELSSRSSI